MRPRRPRSRCTCSPVSGVRPQSAQRRARPRARRRRDASARARAARRRSRVAHASDFAAARPRSCRAAGLHDRGRGYSDGRGERHGLASGRVQAARRRSLTYAQNPDIGVSAIDSLVMIATRLPRERMTSALPCAAQASREGGSSDGVTDREPSPASARSAASTVATSLTLERLRSARDCPELRRHRLRARVAVQHRAASAVGRTSPPSATAASCPSRPDRPRRRGSPRRARRSSAGRVPGLRGRRRAAHGRR